MHNQTDTETFLWNLGQLRFFGVYYKKPSSEFIMAEKFINTSSAGWVPTGKSGYFSIEMPQAQSITSLVLMEDIFFIALQLTYFMLCN